MVSFFKQIYRYSHPRAYRHNETLWPHVQFVREKSGEIARLWYKRQRVPIVPLHRLHNSGQGDVLLTATGPSVNTLSLDAIPVMPALGVNGAYFLNPHVDFRFYVIIDMGFFDRRPDVVRDIIRDAGLILFTTVHGAVRIIDRFSLDAIRCRLAIVENAAYKIYHPCIDRMALWAHYHRQCGVIFADEARDIAFNLDIRRGIFDAGTVAYWALQIVAYLGFRRLFLVGLDMNNFHQPRFYETAQNMQPSFLSDKVTPVVMPALAHASRVMKTHCHMVIKNLSVKSAIDDDIFEKVDVHAYFQQT